MMICQKHLVEISQAISDRGLDKFRAPTVVDQNNRLDEWVSIGVTKDNFEPYVGAISVIMLLGRKFLNDRVTRRCVICQLKHVCGKQWQYFQFIERAANQQLTDAANLGLIERT